MPLKLDIKRKLTARSERVKCVDLHPHEPWMLVCLYNGNAHIWNHEKQQLVKSFEVCELPVRAGKFIARKNWVVTGSDDTKIRVFNYNTLDRVHSFEAHSDYIRSIAVHPTQPYLLTSSDDLLIKLWNWDKQWTCQQVFEGHTHYVMQITINPKDNNTFASASLDRNIKVWQLGSTTANFTLEGHEKGVNCVDYYHGGDKPYLISGGDDHFVKIWDYQTKTCVQTLSGHVLNISAVCFHPELPIILTGSEDGTVRIWHSGTYRLESSLNYGLERVWTIATLKGSNYVAIGYDEGSIMMKVGREEPAISMDVNGGKIVWAKHSEIQLANIKKHENMDVKDGEILSVDAKEMGNCEIYPQTIMHNPNGRFIVVCGDGEYTIYTAMALRNKAFGNAQEFVWAQDSSEYAIREGTMTVKIFKNFKETKSFKPTYGAEGIFGGWLLGIKSNSGLAFYDWDTQDLIMRIDVQPVYIFWSESGELVCLACEDCYYILRFNCSNVNNAKESGGISEDGVDDAFQDIGEVQERVRTGLWVGDCFIYTNSANRLNYYVGGEIVTISHLDRTLYLLGYVTKYNRLYLADKELNVSSYGLQLSVLEYQTAVMRSDFDTADKILPTVPSSYRTRVAHFLQKQGFKQQALVVSNDLEHKFELALQLGDMDTAHELAKESHSVQKWKQLAELAMSKGNIDLTQECFTEANDFGGLLLLGTSSGNMDIISKTAVNSKKDGKNNIAFVSYMLLGKLEECLEILINTDRIPEAAFFARTYLPSHVSRVVALWKDNLSHSSEKASESIADPEQYGNLFPGYAESLKAEKLLLKERQTKIPASLATSLPSIMERKPINEMKKAEEQGTSYQNEMDGLAKYLKEKITLPTTDTIVGDEINEKPDTSLPKPKEKEEKPKIVNCVVEKEGVEEEGEPTSQDVDLKLNGDDVEFDGDALPEDIRKLKVEDFSDTELDENLLLS